jgi:transcriptional regulator with XRE-family HTH domain
MELAAQQLLRALRGRRSQRSLARVLGYRGNPIANWETGRRFPTAREFLRVAAVCRVDVQQAFERFLPAAAERRTVARDLPGWLRELRGSTPIVRVAATMGCSRFAVSRVLVGQSEPRLPDFLRLVEAMTGRASDLVAQFVPIEQVPALEPAHRRREAARTVAFHEPWTEAVLRVLETPAYAASSEPGISFIARSLAIESEVALGALDKLVAAGVVERVGSRHRSAGALTVDTQAAPELVQRVRAHWTRIALQHIERPGPKDQFGYNVFSVAEADLERVRDALRACFREVRAIVANSQGSDVVAVVNLQLVDLMAQRPTDSSA